MDLEQINAKLTRVRLESRELDWYIAVYKANQRYRTKYIEGLSLGYRKTCEWWLKIGDDLFDFYHRHPILENQIKDWYFNEYLTRPRTNPPSHSPGGF